MPELPIQTMVNSGITPSYFSSVTTPTLNATDSFEFDNNGRTFVYVLNARNANTNLDFATPVTLSGFAVGNLRVQVPGMMQRYIGPFRPDLFNDENGQVSMEISNANNLSIAIVQLP